MAIIDPRGLRCGERLRRCTDLARLLWPYLYLSSNSVGRLELSYDENVLAFRFQRPPSEERYRTVILEYRRNWLLFPYLAPDGSTWGQWWVLKGALPKEPRREDLRTPAPPKPAWDAWIAEYRAWKQERAAVAFGELPVSDGSPGGGAAPAELVAAVLEAIRGAFPTADEPIARQLVMVALAVRPGWKASEVLPALKQAHQGRRQDSVGLYFTTLPAVLRTWAAAEAQAAARPVVVEEPASGLSDEEITRRDLERLKQIGWR